MNREGQYFILTSGEAEAVGFEEYLSIFPMEQLRAVLVTHAGCCIPRGTLLSSIPAVWPRQRCLPEDGRGERAGELSLHPEQEIGEEKDVTLVEKEGQTTAMGGYKCHDTGGGGRH